MVTKRQQQKAETRKALITAGINLFATRGIIETSPMDVAQAAGVSVGSFYTHFKSKYRLLEEISITFQESLTATVREHLSQSKTATLEDFVRTHFGAIIDFYSHNVNWATVQSQYLRVGKKSVYPQLTEITTKHVNALYDLYDYRKDTIKEVVVQAEIGIVVHVMDWWTQNHQALDKEQLLGALTKIALDGVYAGDGSAPTNVTASSLTTE